VGWRFLKLTSGILLLLLLFFMGFIISCEEQDWPENLPHGEAILPNFEDPDTPGAWFDFSEGELVFGDEGRQRGDIFLDKTFIAGNPATGIQLCDQQPDSLLYDTTAPGWGPGDWQAPPNAETPSRVPVYDGHNVWVVTGEGNTAKFKIRMAEANMDYTSFLWIKIEWIYQPDGSSELHGIPDPEGETGTTEAG